MSYRLFTNEIKKKNLRHFEEEYLTTKLNDTIYVFKYSQKRFKVKWEDERMSNIYDNQMVKTQICQDFSKKRDKNSKT